MTDTDSNYEQIEVRTPIRLGQFLKLANVVMDGSEAKELIASGAVTVNDECCTHRGAHLTSGDIVHVGADGVEVSLQVAERN